MRWAGGIIRLASFLVPGVDRRGWREEWGAELEALEQARAEPVDRTAEGEGTSRQRLALPTPVGFALGAVPHAIWTRWEGWTMDSLFQDVRFAFRTLGRARGFALVAALTLALGIGANASIFTLVNGLVLSAPPGIEDPDDIVFVARSYDSAPRWDNWSYPAYRTIAENSPVFESVAAHFYRPGLVGEGREARSALTGYVSGSYFSTLGIRPALGRLLSTQDDGPAGSAAVVVLGHGYWTEAFGADPGVLGQTIRVSDAPYEIIGVAAENFNGADVLGSAPDLYMPIQMAPIFADYPVESEWGTSFISVAARLAEGESIESASAAMDAVSMRMREAEPSNDDIRALVAGGFGLPPADREEAEMLSMILAGIAMLVLVLTCANVANLFVARATTRTGEMGVRLALGAGRARLARQLITESVVLGVGAAVLALPLVALVSGVLPDLLPYPLATPPGIGARVFLVILALGVGAGLIFGALPAVAIARGNLTGAIREGGSTGGTARTHLRDALAVAQISVSLALVTGAVLLGRSVMNAATVNPGFDPDGVFVASFDFGSTGRYEGDEAAAMLRRIGDAAEQMPGVEAATVSTMTPFFGWSSRRGYAPGLEWDETRMVEADAYDVAPDYFETMGIRLLSGRVHQASEGLESGDQVVVINETLANRFFPGEDPVGQHLSTNQLFRVIGVVADVQSRSLQSPPTPAVYRPLPVALRFGIVHLRVLGEPAEMIEPFRDLVAGFDPGLPLNSYADLRQRMTNSLGTTQSLGMLVSIFAGLALALSMIGLYGLVTFGVAERRRELGIRLALGSSSPVLVRLILRRALILAMAGVVVGIGLSIPLAGAIRGSLFGIAPFSPGVLALASTILIATSIAAAWIPARRATRIDATLTLRD